jgi:hypothetical protein
MIIKSFNTIRPSCIFDANNAEHRKLFYTFEKTMKWAHCPYQWLIDDDSMDVVHHIRKKMLNYYMRAEFVAKKAKTAPKKPVLKMQDLQKQKKVQN